MIKSNELRIGNYVGIGVRKCKVNSIHAVPEIEESHVRVSGYISTNPAYCVYTHQIEPIPLTPEILEKCEGVERSGYTYYLGGIHSQLTVVLAGYNMIHPKGRVYYRSWTIMDHQPEYLHQLQNLFFALTGTELNINL